LGAVLISLERDSLINSKRKLWLLIIDDDDDDDDDDAYDEDEEDDEDYLMNYVYTIPFTR
jgi:hypothetical protein